MSSLEKVAKANRDSSPWGNGLSSGDDVVRLKKCHRLEINLGRPFDVGGGRGVGGGGGSGPNSCNSGGATEAVGHTYGDDVSSSSSSRFSVGGENFATYSQPFDIFAAAAYSATPYKSPEEMAATAAFPFTFAQWKELERQAMIYKYMISSVPVPSDLLFPHSRNFSAAAALDCPASLYNVRYSRNGDPEPGRCKRTDGKKWRCSRDVAPHQKYCERHLHRGRPRSRKPVEVKNNGEEETLKKSQTHVSTSTTVSVSVSAQQFAATVNNDKPLLLFNAKNDPAASSSSYRGGPNRDLSLMMEGEMVVMDGTDQRWQHLIESNMGFVNVGSSVYGSSSDFHQNYVEQQQPLNVLSYSNFSAPEIDAPTGFIDAWSINNIDSSNSGNAESSSITTNHGNLSPSLNLSIAMAAGNIADQEMGSIEFCDEQGGKGKEDPRWISSLFWEPFARGGPLAEALQSGSVPVSGCKNSFSAPATAVSSPTGVLHRTLFSHSDGSVCNSPAPAAAPTSEIAFHRLN